MGLVNFKEEHYENLRNPEFAADYLQGAYEDSLEEFYHALREIVIAREGVQSLSEKLGRQRCSLYKSLSRSGNPYFETVNDVLHGLGFHLAVVPDVNTNRRVGVSPSKRGTASKGRARPRTTLAK